MQRATYSLSTSFLLTTLLYERFLDFEDNTATWLPLYTKGISLQRSKGNSNSMECEFQITTNKLPSSLFHLLSNTLVLYQTFPYLPISSLLALGATAKDFRELIYKTPHVFRYLKLSDVKSAKFQVGSIDNGGEVWRNAQLGENLTEDESVLPLLT